MEFLIPATFCNSAGVYRILNRRNQKSYIGSTLFLKKRYTKHKCYLLLKKHPNKYLQNAFDKTDTPDFSFELVHVVNKHPNESTRQFLERLQEEENKAILSEGTNNKGSGYNLRISANSNFGVVHHIDALTRRKGHHLSEVTRKRMSMARQGENHPSAKLDEVTVRIIRILIAKGHRNINIANRFGIKKSMINDIKNGGYWSNITIKSQEVLDFDDAPYVVLNPSRLNDDTVREIKQLLQEELSSKEIAAKVGVKPRAVTDIRSGKTYKHI